MENSAIKDLAVDVTYKNRDMETVSAKTYAFREYMSMKALEVRRLILDVEDLVYALQDGKQKDEWSDQAIAGFSMIRHKLLDKAGDIERLPDNIRLMSADDKPMPDAEEQGHKEFETVDEFIRDFFSK